MISENYLLLREEDRQRIAADVARYEGEITVVPPGASAYSEQAIRRLEQSAASEIARQAREVLRKRRDYERKRGQKA